MIVGDGALQQTAAELGTLLALGLAPIVIVLNNDGYTTERAINSPSAAYHDIPAWNWTALPAAFAADLMPLAIRAITPVGFNGALRAASRHAGRPILIEAVLDREDTPPMLTDLARALAASNAPR
jgi:indolepyruvate decarboxylase